MCSDCNNSWPLLTFNFKKSSRNTEMVISFRTDKSGQTADPDQGLRCSLFYLHVFDKIPSGFASLFEY